MYLCLFIYFFQPAVGDAVSGDNHIFGLSQCCRMLQPEFLLSCVA